jgi:hypothetical protein
MKRTLVVCLASLLVSRASSAADLVLVRVEFYYNTNPEIRQVVGAIHERSNRELTEMDRGFEDVLLGMGSARELSNAERDRRISESLARHQKVEDDANAEIYAVLERTAPYLLLECVVAPSGAETALPKTDSVETALTEIQGHRVTIRVGLWRFVDGTPWLFASVRDNDSTGGFFGDEMPRPFPFNVPVLVRQLGFGSKDPVHADFQRASLAPKGRATGCSVTQPGGEAPPPILRKPGPPMQMLNSPVRGAKY